VTSNPRDVVDTAPADPEATARAFVRLRHALAPDHGTWDELHPFERALLVFTLAALLDLLRRQGAR
jgi:hypothetical protein